MIRLVLHKTEEKIANNNIFNQVLKQMFKRKNNNNNNE